jgi:hypothetical protein
MMLAHAARHSIRDLPDDLGMLHSGLIATGVLAKGGPRHGRNVDWPELESDLGRLAAVGVRLPACDAIGTHDSRPATRHSGSDARRHAKRTRPTIADACVELAAMAAARDPRSTTAAR